ncbi:hypothetical protein AB6A40_008979 [Gnathostoma spinigerum]|uniref:mannosyl-oligosaccharide 1,3-1,6-alpha-mannosidase n=1 Tax=Gnathostoma spinigerum TaxID=75299 RepID=A0ABD6ERU1_9BILA
MLYDQYRKKAQLFKYNVVLVPLGDDFRYDKDFEWIDQYSNYKKLFDYMNTRKDWNVNVRFGTLSDYFGILNRRISEQVTEKPQLPVLSGDFFTYADRNDHYWSGYYTSRPFYKRMDRVAQHFLRSAELLYSFSSVSSKWMSNYFDLLVEARRHVSLFQHHDGVTGTAKDAVVVDYGKKLLNAIQNCEKIITTATAALMSDNSESSQLSFITTDEKRVQHDVLPVKVTITNQSDIVLFNPLAQERNEVVCLYVNSSDTKIQYISSSIAPIEQQIGPVLHRADFTILVSDDEYELCFVASLPGFGMRRYRLTHGGSDIRKAKILSSPGFAVHAGSFDISTVSDPEYMMRNEHVEARFDAVTGLLKSVKVEGREEMDTKISFVTYGARARNKAKFPTGGDSLSGAYLFLPDGPSKPIRLDNSYIIVEGPLCKKASSTLL